MIGHEGDGSLLSYLKTEGLANGVSAGTGSYISTPGFNFFTVDMELTIEGLSKRMKSLILKITCFANLGRWQEVLYSVYQYIAMLRKEGPKEWIFEECKVS